MMQDQGMPVLLSCQASSLGVLASLEGADQYWRKCCERHHQCLNCSQFTVRGMTTLAFALRFAPPPVLVSVKA